MIAGVSAALSVVVLACILPAVPATIGLCTGEWDPLFGIRLGWIWMQLFAQPPWGESDEKVRTLAVKSLFFQVAAVIVPVGVLGLELALGYLFPTLALLAVVVATVPLLTIGGLAALYAWLRGPKRITAALSFALAAALMAGAIPAAIFIVNYFFEYLILPYLKAG